MLKGVQGDEICKYTDRLLDFCKFTDYNITKLFDRAQLSYSLGAA